MLLPWSQFKLGLEHKMTYNSLSATPKSLKFWETIVDIALHVLEKIQLYWWRPQRVITLKRNWLQNWSWNFRYLNLSQYVSKWLEIFLTYISFMIYKIPKLHIQKSSNKGDMTKKPDLTQNLHKLITFTKPILFFWNFENRTFYSFLQSLQVSFQDLFIVDLDLDLKIWHP